MGTKVHLQQINHAPRPGVYLWGLPVSNYDGHDTRKPVKPTLDFLRRCPLEAHQRTLTAAHSHSLPGLNITPPGDKAANKQTDIIRMQFSFTF